MKNLIVRIVLLLLPMVLIVSEAAAAGTGMGTGMGAPCGGPFPPCPVPLDGGLGILAGLGLAYGGKKLINHKRKNRD
jgi:hypothetical protein